MVCCVVKQQPHLPGPGAYILYVCGQKLPDYVGRSDTDLKERLAKHTHCPICGRVVEYFESCDAATADDAYLMECHFYHQYRPKKKKGSLCNLNHPACPGPDSPPCPVCHTCYRS